MFNQWIIMIIILKFYETDDLILTILLILLQLLKIVPCQLPPTQYPKWRQTTSPIHRPVSRVKVQVNHYNFPPMRSPFNPQKEIYYQRSICFNSQRWWWQIWNLCQRTKQFLDTQQFLSIEKYIWNMHVYQCK